MSQVEDAREELKIIKILLAGLLLKEEPRPNVGELENFIHVRKGTLSELIPQRQSKKAKSSKNKQR